jgi:hypothetical protein
VIFPREKSMSKKSMLAKKRSCFPKKESVLQKRKPFFEKGSSFPKKEGVLQKKSMFNVTLALANLKQG